MPPEIRRCQRFGCSDTHVIPAAAPYQLPCTCPCSPSLLCSHKKTTWDMKNLAEYSLPPHILSSPNRWACDRIHHTATGSRGEGKLCMVSGAQVHSWSGQPSPQSCNQNFTSSTRAAKITPPAQGITPLLPWGMGICKQHVPKHSWVYSLCKGKNISFLRGKKREGVDCG